MIRPMYNNTVPKKFEDHIISAIADKQILR